MTSKILSYRKNLKILYGKTVIDIYKPLRLCLEPECLKHCF